MNQELKLNLQLGSQNYSFMLASQDEIPMIAKKFCTEHKLNQNCIDYIIQAFNQQINNSSENSQYRQSDDSYLQKTYETWQNRIKQKLNDKSYDKKNQKKDQELLNNYSFKSDLSRQHSQRSKSQISINKSQTQQKDQSKSPIKKKLINQQLFDKLYQDGEIKRQKQYIFETLKKEKSMQNCTFTPRINRSSSQIAEKKNSPFKECNIVQKLYQKNKIIEEKKKQKQIEVFNQIHPFQPNSEYKPLPQSLKQQQAFAERKLYEKQEYERMMEIRRIQKQQSHPFHPKINKDYYHQKVTEKQKIIKEKQQLQKYLNDELDSYNTKKQYKLQPNQVKSLKFWFQLMDSDNDGIISPQNIDLSQIPNLNIIQNFLFYIDENRLSVDFGQFVSLMEDDPETLKKILNQDFQQKQNPTPMYQKYLQM